MFKYVWTNNETPLFSFRYVIQISDPGYFINHWEEERRLSLDRHKPRFLILPWNQSSPVADQFFNLPQTEFNSDFLLVEVMKGNCFFGLIRLHYKIISEIVRSLITLEMFKM